MITYTTSKTDNELSEILDLQKNNLPPSLTASEMQSQGFVTVCHSFEDLKKLNDYERHVIIKDQNKVVGYLLAMTQHSKLDIPVLVPMFEMFEQIMYKGQLISAYNFIVVGQVCIDKDYRGRGLLDSGYAFYQNHLKGKYDFAITEIVTSNTRSINAHKRIGFVEVHRFTDINQIEWSIVIWDWAALGDNA